MNNFFTSIRTAWKSLPGRVVLVASVFFLAALTTSCDQKPPGEKTRTATINNVEPRRDAAGEIIDAHDGCLQFFNGHYYLYGTAYGKTDGITNNDFRVYSSPDLEHWTFEGTLLKDRPYALYYRPYVVFNPSTRKYVLWYNWYRNSTDWFGRHGAAISDTPVGPFIIATPDVQLSHPGDGDGSLFVDDDGTGYFIYTSINEGYTIRVERLTPDYLGATGQTSSVLAVGGEAPVLFRRNNLYYALFGARCAFCPEGSEAQVFTSNSPLGSFTTKPEANINHRSDKAGPATSRQETWDAKVTTPSGPVTVHSDHAGPVFGGDNVPFIHAQQTWVAKIPISGETVFFWMADRWQSTPDGIKGHDFQYWSAPLKFGPDGSIEPLKNITRWDIIWGAGN